MTDIQTIDLSTISDAEIKAEYWRRIGAQARNRSGGRKEQARPCEICSQPFGARRLRTHLPACRALRGRLYLNDKQQEGHPLELRAVLAKKIENRHAGKLKRAEIWLLDGEAKRTKLIGGLRKVPTENGEKYDAWLEYPAC